MAAAKISSNGNEQAMTKMMDNAKNQAESDRVMQMERGATTHEEAAKLAAAKIVRDDMLERESILKDEGDEQILKEAMENGSSVVCARCGELIAFTRWEAHHEKWCPMLPENENKEDSN